LRRSDEIVACRRDLAAISQETGDPWEPAGLVPLDFTDLVSQSIRHTPNRIACCHRWDKRRPGASQGMLAGPMTFSPRRVPLQIV
jgi:hypothetical protein